MTQFRILLSRYRAFSWLLVAAVVVLTFQPRHMHVHHVDIAETVSHDHVIDTHVIFNMDDVDHQEQHTVLSFVPDVLIKKLSDNPLLPALFIFLFAFSHTFILHFKRRFTDYRQFIEQSTYHFSPPLRAPPRFIP